MFSLVCLIKTRSPRTTFDRSDRHCNSCSGFYYRKWVLGRRGHPTHTSSTQPPHAHSNDTHAAHAHKDYAHTRSAHTYLTVRFFIDHAQVPSNAIRRIIIRFTQLGRLTKLSLARRFSVQPLSSAHTQRYCSGSHPQ